MNTKEEWRPVGGFEGRYEVSNLGRVRSLRREIVRSDGRRAIYQSRDLRGSRGTLGYMGVVLDRGHRALVHRLVAAAFLGEPEPGQVVNHLNGDKWDNRLENLEWCSIADNNRHARRVGLHHQHGENCNLTKYSSHLVASVRRVHAAYQPNYSDLALLFDISQAQAADIIKGRTRAYG